MKLYLHNLSARHLLILGMAVPTLLLVLVGGLQWKSGNDFRASRERVTHSRTVLLDLQSLLSCVLDAETGQRGYLLVQQESYLKPYNDSLGCSHDLIKKLRQCMPGPGQQKDLDLLETSIQTKFDELGQTLSLERSGDHAGALQIVSLDTGEKTMDGIRSAIGAMQDTETSLFQQQEAAYQRNSTINAELSALLLVLGFGSIAALIIYFLLRRSQQMQEMITICAWSKLIEFEGEWLSMEEYLSRRLHARVTHGISRAEAEKMLKLLEYEKLKKFARAEAVASRLLRKRSNKNSASQH